MKLFSCGAVIPQCDESFEAETDQDILQQVTEHARTSHDIVELTAATRAEIRRSIVDVA